MQALVCFYIPSPVLLCGKMIRLTVCVIHPRRTDANLPISCPLQLIFGAVLHARHLFIELEIAIAESSFCEDAIRIVLSLQLSQTFEVLLSQT